MAKPKAGFSWPKAPTYGELTDVLETLGKARPRPTIKVNIGAKDIPQDALEAWYAFAGEHGVEFSASVIAQYSDGQQLTFWDPVHAAGAEVA